MLLQYVKESKSKANKLETAKELRRMVFFSNLVVVKLLEEIKPDAIQVIKPPEKPKQEEDVEGPVIVEEGTSREEMQKQTKVEIFQYLR